MVGVWGEEVCQMKTIIFCTWIKPSSRWQEKSVYSIKWWKFRFFLVGILLHAIFKLEMIETVLYHKKKKWKCIIQTERKYFSSNFFSFLRWSEPDWQTEIFLSLDNHRTHSSNWIIKLHRVFARLVPCICPFGAMFKECKNRNR